MIIVCKYRHRVNVNSHLSKEKSSRVAYISNLQKVQRIEKSNEEARVARKKQRYGKDVEEDTKIMLIVIERAILNYLNFC